MLFSCSYEIFVIEGGFRFQGGVSVGGVGNEQIRVIFRGGAECPINCED